LFLYIRQTHTSDMLEAFKNNSTIQWC